MEKNKKEAKTFPLKKLTGFFKISYTQKKFDKILKKIYIPEDKEKIQSLFSEKYQKGNKELLRIPRDKNFTKKELVQLKTLVFQILLHPGMLYQVESQWKVNTNHCDHFQFLASRY